MTNQFEVELQNADGMKIRQVYVGQKFEVKSVSYINPDCYRVIFTHKRECKKKKKSSSS